MIVARLARGVNDSLNKAAADAAAPELRQHVQPLHLAAGAIARARPQRDKASRNRRVASGTIAGEAIASGTIAGEAHHSHEQRAPGGGRVGPRQPGALQPGWRAWFTSRPCDCGRYGAHLNIFFPPLKEAPTDSR